MRRTVASGARRLCALAASCVARPAGGIASAQSAAWPTERPPQPLPARDIKFPPYEIQTLPNGLQVVVGACTTSSRR